MQKIRDKSVLISSESFIGLFKRENLGKGEGRVYGEGEMILEFRIDFPDPKLVTFDTPRPHGPNTKYLKMPMPKKISKNKVRKLHPPTPNHLYTNQKWYILVMEDYNLKHRNSYFKPHGRKTGR